MALKIDSLEVNIKTQADSASASIENLNKQLSKIARKKSQLNDLAKAMEKVKDNADAMGGGTGGGGGSGGGSRGSKKGGILSSVTGKAGGFLKSIGRIALYRGIRTALKAVTTSIKEGTSNLYQFSKLMGGSFANNLDKVSTSVQYLKNGLAVGLAPVVEALTPTIVAASDALANAGNRLSEMYAWQNNKDTFTRATKSAKEYAQSLKDVKNAVLGFDELNVIDNNNEKNFAEMFGIADVDPQRARETKAWVDGILAGAAGIGAVSLAGKWFPSLLGFTKGEGGTATYDLGDVTLKAAGLSLIVAGEVTGWTAIADLIKSNFENNEALAKLGIGLVETGAGFSLMTKSPIPFLITLAAGVVIGGVTLFKSLEDYKKYNATHDRKTGEALYEEWQLEGMYDPLTWEQAGKPGGTYEKYVADYATAKLEGKDAPDSNAISEEEWEAARASGNKRLLNYYKQVAKGHRGRDYYLEHDLKQWVPRNEVMNSQPAIDIVDDDTVVSEVRVSDSELAGSSSDSSGFWEALLPIIQEVVGIGAPDIESGGTGNTKTTGQNINLYLDGNQIVGAVRKADALGGVYIGRGIVWE